MHNLVNGSPVSFVHLVELVNAADTLNIFKNINEHNKQNYRLACPSGSTFIFSPGSGSTFIFPPGSGSAFNILNKGSGSQEGKNARKLVDKKIT